MLPPPAHAPSSVSRILGSSSRNACTIWEARRETRLMRLGEAGGGGGASAPLGPAPVPAPVSVPPSTRPAAPAPSPSPPAPSLGGRSPDDAPAAAALASGAGACGGCCPKARLDARAHVEGGGACPPLSRLAAAGAARPPAMPPVDRLAAKARDRTARPSAWRDAIANEWRRRCRKLRDVDVRPSKAFPWCSLRLNTYSSMFAPARLIDRSLGPLSPPRGLGAGKPWKMRRRATSRACRDCAQRVPRAQRRLPVSADRRCTGLMRRDPRPMGLQEVSLVL